MNRTMTAKEMIDAHDKLSNMAFPMAVEIQNTDGSRLPGFITGFSKKEYAALFLLQGMLSTGEFSELTPEGNIVGRDVCIDLAINYADRLIDRMNEPKKKPEVKGITFGQEVKND